jgi:methylenetetrahydrofolate dehydrogenase (NADP+) / methenyltetrahydrofolate cyclohydrolase
MGKLIDGKLRAKQVRDEVKRGVEEAKKRGINPKLVVVLVGDDPASHTYVSNKEKACAEAGIISEAHKLPGDTPEADLINLLDKLAKDKSVHGILVQLPVPDHISEEKILSRIPQEKDVDGLGVTNMGLIVKGEGDPLVCCTPNGCIDLIKTTGVEISGKTAVVVGRSNMVGKPMAILLLKENATVTICHSKTKDLGKVTKEADILVAAIGKAKMIKADMVKPGAIVIDVGTSHVDGKLCGDVDFDAVKDIAGHITPVPGGVGPMTIAMLLKNTLKTATKS